MQRTAEEIRELIEGYRNRGERSRREYCESVGLTLSALDYYLRRYGKPATRLARVKVRSSVEPRAARFTLVLSNGRRIECGEAELQQMITTAEAV